MTNDKYYSGNKGIKLFPTKSQYEFLDKCIIGYKIVFNWALDLEYRQYNKFCNGETDRSFLSFIDIQNIYSEFRETDELLKELPSHTLINAVRDMVKGYELFLKYKDIFNRPRFKNFNSLFSSFHPRAEKSTFYYINDSIRIEGLHYQELIKTSYNFGNSRELGITFIDPTITKNNRTGEYFLSYKILKDKYLSYFDDNNIEESEPIGIDINKDKMFACSNGMIFERPDYSRIEKHIANINREIQKDRDRINQDIPISNNMLFRLNQRKELYERITNLNKNTAYKASLELIKLHPKVIILESLDIKSMYSKSFIAKEINNCSFATEQKILVEQCNKYNVPVIYAPRDFQSSNICSNCGAFKNIGTYKNFVCGNCGMSLDRDINAAINLKNWYIDNFQ